MREIQSYISESNKTSLDTKKTGFVDTSNITMNMQNYREMKQQNQLEEREEKKDVEMILLAYNSPRQIPKHQVNIEQNPQNVPKSVETKEKLIDYWILSNLAYAKFDKIDATKRISLENLKPREVSLDLLWIDFTKFEVKDWILIRQEWKSLNHDEESLLSYLSKQDNYNINDFRITEDDYNINDFFKVAEHQNNKEKTEIASLISKTTYANIPKNIYNKINYPQYSEIISDWWIGNFKITDPKLLDQQRKINENIEFIEKNKKVISKWLIELREDKKSEYMIQWTSFKEKYKDVKILSYYPENKEEEKSWFQCVLFEKWWKKILSIAWTQITDFWDIKADFSLLRWKLPERQTKSLIDFFNKNNITKNDNLVIVWHSLWWALSQVATSIYWPWKDDKSPKDSYNILEAYTFNSPWVRDVSVTEWKDLDENYKKEFEKFTKNRLNDIIEEKITNVKWTKWLSLIAGLWNDIGFYEINLKNFSSHSIVELINYLKDKNLDINELVRKINKRKKDKKMKN